MAAPLFVTDRASLVNKLRLSAVPADALDTQAIIDEAILQARVKFYTSLGADRVNTILASTFTETATTDAEVLRAMASSTEVKMVYCTLLRLLPNTFMDASGDVNKRWGEEAPTRERGFSELEEELRRCEQEVDSAMNMLAAPSTVVCDDVQVYDGTPVRQTSFPTTTPRIGQSLRPGCRYRPTSND